MTEQKAKRIFFNWLKKQGIYEQYKYNRHETNSTHGSYYFRNPLYPSSYIIDAFSWELTPQGYDFWQAINVKWGRYYEKVLRDPRYN